ncbi:hypothetical protein JXA47_04755 [Candidatus Sumerlaeota bacterium]|nr:hypothetical protein [Candidatus Sumerlaeota bacterium]
MKTIVRTLWAATLLTVGLAGSAAAYTHHIGYPIETPCGAPRGTVEFRNHGNLVADIYIDGAYIGQIAPGDQVVVHDVWAGGTEVRWEYTFNYDGVSEQFHLEPWEHVVWDFAPVQSVPRYHPRQIQPTDIQPVAVVYPEPVNDDFTIEFGEDDWFVSISGNGLYLDFD